MKPSLLCSVVLPFMMSAFSGCTPSQPISKQYPQEVSALDTEGGKGLPYLVGTDLRPVWKTEGAPPVRTLNDFHLVDQKGREISSETLRGKISMVSFFYSECPGICPMTTKNLKVIQEKFKNDDRFLMVSFSVTPQTDTPQQLAKFAQKYNIFYQRWRLVTGNRDQIYRLARESFGADTISEKENALLKLKPEDFLHSENIYLLDGNQKLRGVYATQMVSSLQELARDAESLAQ